MDPLYLALSSYRKRKFAICADICTEILQEDACQRAAWLLKMRALTQQVFYDDLEIIEGLVDGGNEAVEATLMTTTAKPGTSINKCPTTASTNRPRTQGRAISGVVRFNQLTTASNEATKTARIETASRLSRLGTASMLPHSRDFINVSRLNLPTYAAMKDTAKILFEYLYFVEGDMKKALELADESIRMTNGDEFYWKCAINRCLIRLGLVRQVIRGNSDWCTKMNQPDGILLMAKAHLIIDQPLAAIDIYQKGMLTFSKETHLLIAIARVYEELNQLDNSVCAYKKVLANEAGSVEAVACIATNFFYSGQPELALLLYRRLLQMGIHTAEIFNNIALCCLYTQQFEMIFSCVDNALTLAKKDVVADVWYNLGHIAMVIGKLDMACVCWQISMSINKKHSGACNNLGVVAMMQGRLQEAKALFQTAASLDDPEAEAAENLEKFLKEEDWE